MNDPVEHAKQSIDQVFSDTDVSLEVTLDRLERIEVYLEECITAIREDIEVEEVHPW